MELTSLEANTLEALKALLHQAIQQNDAGLKDETIGMMALLLNNVVRRKDPALFRQTLREIGISVEDADAKWIFRVTKQDLEPELQEWMDAQIERIMAGADGWEDDE